MDDMPQTKDVSENYLCKVVQAMQQRELLRIQHYIN